MDIIQFLRSSILDGSKLANRHFLKTVKSMDYDELCDVIGTVIPDLYMTFPLFHSDEWYEFISLTIVKQSTSSYGVIDEDYVISDCKVEYPVTLKQIEKEQWKLEGIAPHCLSMFIHGKLDGVLNLPLVIECMKTLKSKDDLYHQTILVFDFRKGIAFLYDPNGQASRYNTNEVHYAIESYVNLLNSPIKYIRLQNDRVNLHHKGISGGNCVVCCILFMIAYSLLHLDVNTYDHIQLQSKSLLTKLHVLLYNALGYELQRFTP